MNTKIFVILCIIIALLGIGVGIFLNTRSSTEPTAKGEQQPVTEKSQEIPLQQSNAPIPFNSLPSPVIPPVQDIVKEIGETTMIVDGVNGEMTLPLDSSVVKLFRQQEDQLIPLSLSDLKKGDSVEVQIIKPGERIHLIMR